ncbi:type ISP restriction/modification enzyme [Streptomyces sp. NPDC048411]|uniref:type ISP restriction/modification enzyme n=1 Tax=Streptomyces sp. NPDC048411 TaxID=3157206 RepID=UPI0034530F21
MSAFGKSCKTKLAGGGGTEAAIRSPLEALLAAVGTHHSLDEFTWHDEVSIPELGVRPDYAIQIDGLVSGYIEIKKPGLSVDPESFTGRNKAQWERLRDLPNLLYTNGTEWRLFRNGTQLGETVWFTGSLKVAGDKLVPQDPSALDALLQAFLLWAPPPIRQVSRLVQHVAPLCRLLRGAVLEQLAAEAKSPAKDGIDDLRPFSGLKSDWRKLLFPTANDATFADGYAQTVTFALLLARTEDIDLTKVSLHEVGRKLDAGHALMGKALQLLTDNVNQRFEVTLNLLLRTISCVDWRTIRQGNRDAYLHLYENFLTVYDANLRQKSGSYYTPREVVEEMVRLTDDVLRTRLAKTQGYAEDDVRIVDPAMGTGTFLHTIIERVASQAADRSGPAMAKDAINRLARRLYGFELQMGPFAVAEMRASDLLKRHDATLPKGGLNLFVTDTLDNPFVEEQELLSTYGVLSTSRKRANEVKGKIPVTVVIGNPPYDHKAEDRGGWVEKRPRGKERPLLDGFRYPGNGRYEHFLKNMYVYFWRWATWKVFDAHEADQHGVICFITPSGFATGPGGRGMRDYLRRTCDEGWVINLTPEGQRPDVGTRVFPKVAQPLAICIFVRRKDTDPERPARIHYRSVSGKQQEKFRQLKEIRLDDEGWRDTHDADIRPFTPATQSGWDDFPELGDLFPWGSLGVTSNRSWVSSPSADTLRHRWARLIGESDPAEKAELFKKTRDRDLERKRASLPGRRTHALPIGEENSTSPDMARIARRSFDRQWLIADNRVIDFPRPDLWAALRENQLFLNQQSTHVIESGPAVMATTLIPDTDHFNGRGGRNMPLLHPDGTANVPKGLLTYMASVLGLDAVTVQDMAAYTIGVAGHTLFTEHFSEELLTAGVRLPLTRDRQIWQKAVTIGSEALWVMTYGEYLTSPEAPWPVGEVEFPVGDPRQVRYLTHIGAKLPEKMWYEAATETLHVGESSFGPVPQEVWNFDVGGMLVLRHWFGYRKDSPNNKKTSPLDKCHVDVWPGEWTEELIKLLSMLRRLVNLLPAQRELLAEVLANPVITEENLRNEGILPVQKATRNPRRNGAQEEALFLDS